MVGGEEEVFDVEIEPSVIQGVVECHPLVAHVRGRAAREEKRDNHIIHKGDGDGRVGVLRSVRKRQFHLRVILHTRENRKHGGVDVTITRILGECDPVHYA